MANGWVLKATDNTGKPFWFKEMTAIGPSRTYDRAEAHVFDSRLSAALSPAMKFIMSDYMPEEATNG